MYTSVRRYENIAIGLLKNEEEEEEERRRRMPNHDFYFARCIRILALYNAHSIGNQS